MFWEFFSDFVCNFRNSEEAILAQLYSRNHKDVYK